MAKKLKKGATEFFKDVEKLLDEIFGFGEDVSDHALTPSEKRYKDRLKKDEVRRKRREEQRQDRNRMTNKADGGQKFRKPVLKKMIKELEEKYKHLELKVEIVSKNSGHKMIIDGKKVKRFYEWKKKGTLGAFAHHPPPPKLYILEDCTKLTWQHEVRHLEDYAELGHEAYMAKQPWLREKTVWDKIWENRHMWTDEELADSCEYYRKFANKNGGNPILNEDMKSLLKKYESRFKK